jgi:hypothetical protein
MKSFIACVLSTLLYTVSAAQQHVNDTVVDVYVNQISSCSLNTETRNMFCIHRAYQDVVEYHEVRDVAMCENHYCVTFSDNMSRMVCSGYVYLLVDGMMDDYRNPLTQFPHTFKGKTRQVKTSLNGYNIRIDRFDENVETIYQDNIDSVVCHGKYATHVSLSEYKSYAFGLLDITYRSDFESFVLGIVVCGSIALVLYICLACTKCFDSFFSNIFVVPILVMGLFYVILFVAKHFIVKIGSFGFGTVIGIFGAYLIKRAYKKRKNNKRVNVIDTEREQLTRGGFENDSDSEEGDFENNRKRDSNVVEIELSKNNTEASI